MLALKKIAVTGSIASGKSTVCAYFREWGACVLESDRILHEGFERSESLKQSLVQILGTDIVQNGTLSRSRIADIVFSKQALLQKVETVCHEYLFQILKNEFDRAVCEGQASFFVVEVPLLYESTHRMLLEWFDLVLFVHTPHEVCRERYLAKGKTKEDFERRYKRLLPEEEKMRRADFCIENRGTVEEVRDQLLALFQKIEKSKKLF